MSTPYEKPPPYAPPAQGYAPPPQQQGYPPQQPGYAPPPQGYAPPPQGYPPPQQGYAPPPQGYPPQAAGGNPTVVVVNNSQPQPQPQVTTQVITTHVNHQSSVNHCLHCVISLFFWPWIIVWMILCCTEGC